MTTRSPSYLVLGRLCREYIITPAHETIIDQPGGNALYTAEGLSLWLDDDDTVGIVSRVGEDYPRNWIEDFKQKGYSTEGIKILPGEVDVRYFRAYTDLRTSHTEDPVSHFAQLEISVPRSLLGYKNYYKELDTLNEVTKVSLIQTDLPKIYEYASVAHIGPVDFMTHSLMPAALRQVGLTTITLDPGSGYMHPDFLDHLPGLLRGITAFLPAEEDLRSLFRERSEDLWEMAETISSWGCEIVVIKRGEKGQLLYDSSSNLRYEIPAYPSKMVDPTGAGDVFSGGFLAGYRKTYNPLQAVLHGNVSASFAVEGSGVFYARAALPGLQQARLDSLKEFVRRV